ncbi:MAG: Plug domain-containing protein [Rhodanobacter sp.]
MTAPGVHVRVTRERLQLQNPIDSSDVLKYTPNMQVRTRYPGDPNAVISGRNTGTLQSARSLVYADGLLLSKLMTSGWDGAPRWGMAAPQESGAVDVPYGPYSALYPGNVQLDNGERLDVRLDGRVRQSLNGDATVEGQTCTDAVHITIRYAAGGELQQDWVRAADGHQLTIYCTWKLPPMQRPIHFQAQLPGRGLSLEVPRHSSSAGMARPSPGPGVTHPAARPLQPICRMLGG